jgi:hypothetical protein
MPNIQREADMYHRDSPTQREQERRANQAAVRERAVTGSLVDGKSEDEIRAEEERTAGTISRPGGFHNDPDVPTNPNEARERYLRKLRCLRIY